MNITVTPAAEDFMRRMLTVNVGAPHADLRLTVTPGGCAGFVVQVRLQALAQPGDTVLEVNGLKVFVPPESRALLAGATLACRDGATACGLTILNPNVSDCGCGSQGAGRGGRHATVSVVPFGPKR